MTTTTTGTYTHRDSTTISTRPMTCQTPLPPHLHTHHQPPSQHHLLHRHLNMSYDVSCCHTTTTHLITSTTISTCPMTHRRCSSTSYAHTTTTSRCVQRHVDNDCNDPPSRPPPSITHHHHHLRTTHHHLDTSNDVSTTWPTTLSLAQNLNARRGGAFLICCISFFTGTRDADASQVQVCL